MNVTETTRTFLEFFGDRGHQVVPGSSLVPPAGDPVLFTTAGMHPLTRYLEGRPHPQGRRLAGVQRCLRTTDLDEVGDDRHLTVFQMLGSWSLGDYDGLQSLRWGWELLTDRLGIRRDRSTRLLMRASTWCQDRLCLRPDGMPGHLAAAVLGFSP
jgi:alanyl-tRNA synthetase